MCNCSKIVGYLLILVGVILLLANLGIIPVALIKAVLWPAILIGIGVWMLLRARCRARKPAAKPQTCEQHQP
jgi:hypothetical protein